MRSIFSSQLVPFLQVRRSVPVTSVSTEKVKLYLGYKVENILKTGISVRLSGALHDGLGDRNCRSG